MNYSKYFLGARFNFLKNLTMCKLFFLDYYFEIYLMSNIYCGTITYVHLLYVSKYNLNHKCMCQLKLITPFQGVPNGN
jgi:hypothetical protein